MRARAQTLTADTIVNGEVDEDGDLIFMGQSARETVETAGPRVKVVQAR